MAVEKKVKRSKKLFSFYRQRNVAEPGRVTTVMHQYKRDLTPLKEMYTVCDERPPYRDENIKNYEGSLLSMTLKNELLNNLGKGAKCLRSVSRGAKTQSILTFFIDSTATKTMTP